MSITVHNETGFIIAVYENEDDVTIIGPDWETEVDDSTRLMVRLPTAEEIEAWHAALD